ncbi:MAG: M14 family zinc carboxypeptidase [Planctomycetota bacterium]
MNAYRALVRAFARRAAVVTLTTASMTVSAQLFVDHAEPWKTYDGQTLIRTWPETPRQILAVNALNLVLMDESLRVGGGTAWIATPDQLEALRHVGVRLDIIDGDVGPRVRAERARLDAERTLWQQLDVFGRVARIDDSFFDEYRPYQDDAAPDLLEFLDQLEADHPNLISSQVIGQSQAENRPITAHTISTGGSNKPAVFFTAGAHAREWINPMTTIYMMDRLLDGYGVDAGITTILDAIDVHVVAMSNPDGYVYSWETDRFWRKTRRGGFGVDWNRNFSAGFGLGSSGNTGSDTYRGTGAFSEPETRAIRDFVQANPEIVAHVDVHSFSQLILYPYGYTNDLVPGFEGEVLESIAERMSDTIMGVSGEFYNPQPAAQLYIAGGTSMDWTFEGAGLLSWTYELRPNSQGAGGFDPPPTEIRPTAEECFEAFQDLLGSAASGISGRVLNGGPPSTVNEGQPQDVLVEILPAFTGPLDPSTATLFTRSDGGAFVPSAMNGSSTAFTGTLPAATCGQTLEWYVTIGGADGIEYTYPVAGDMNPFSADVVGVQTAFFDDLEADNLDWSLNATNDDATSGRWERGDPEATAAQPEDDHTPDGTIAFVTGVASGGSLGANDVDDGRTTLTSPKLNAAPPAGYSDEDAFIVYHYWYSNDTGANPNSDAFTVRLANDNGVLWEIIDADTTGTNNAWAKRSIRIADFMQPTADMRIQFIVTDLNGGSVVEAAVDDVTVEFRGCVGSPNPADIAPPFGLLDLADVDAFIAGFIAGDLIADIVVPFGVLDLGDVDAFITAFLGG